MADECDRMPETKAWSGPAYTAANQMFTRAATASSQFSHYTEAIAKAMVDGSRKLSAARNDLLNRADEVEKGGELSVNDLWVVLIKPARVSAEKAASLEAQAKAEQSELNRLLTTVGDVDDGIAQSLLAGQVQLRRNNHDINKVR